MKTCTFFGHRNAPLESHPAVAVKLIELISKHGVDRFYVGAQGDFDHYTVNALIEVKMLFPHIDINIVLPKIPDTLPKWGPAEYTIVPEGIENAPPRFAIDKCNRWMLEKSDYVIGYVTRRFGGAAKYLREAEKKGKTVINLANNND